MESFVREVAPDARVVHANLYLDSYRTNPADLLIVGGGGVWGATGTGQLDDALYSAWMKAKCPLAIANISLETFDVKRAERLRNLGAKAAFLSFRDRESWSLARDILGDSKILWGGDTSYLRPMRLRRRPNRSLIGVNLCNPAQENLLRLKASTGIARSVSSLANQGFDLRGVAFRAGGPRPDHVFCRQVDASCPEEFSSTVFEECDAFIGMRYHSIVLAFQNLIPVIAIVCSAKVKRIMEEYSLEEYSLDPSDPDFSNRLRSAVQTVREEKVIQKIREGNRNTEARLVPVRDRLRTLIENP